jgi:hypothetical protein
MSLFRSELPSAATATDFVGLRRAVCTLQAEVEQQRARQGSLAEHRDVAVIGRAREDYASLRRLVCSIQEELDATKKKQAAQQEDLKALKVKTGELQVKTGVLNAKTEKILDKTEELEERLDDLADEGDEGEDDDADADASDSAENAAGADSSVSHSVAAVHRSLDDGEWVAISGHLWKKSDGGSGAPELVSPREMDAQLHGRTWADFSCWTDKELEKIAIVRAGRDRTIPAPITSADLDAADEKYLAELQTENSAVTAVTIEDAWDY